MPFADSMYPAGPGLVNVGRALSGGSGLTQTASWLGAVAAGGLLVWPSIGSMLLGFTCDCILSHHVNLLQIANRSRGAL
jgi:hypothetical protein